MCSTHYGTIIVLPTRIRINRTLHNKCLFISNSDSYRRTPEDTMTSFVLSGNGTNVQSRIGKSFLYKDKLDYVCKQGYVYNNSITRQRLVCDLYNGSEYATWNGTELHCSSE